jgi:branched-chain amino acid transport system permease protein
VSSAGSSTSRLATPAQQPAHQAGPPPAEIAAWRRHLAAFLLGRRALVVPIVGAIVLLLFPTLSGNNAYWINQLSQIGMLALVVSGVNLSFGYAGEVQFGQVFMFALGAYLGGILSVHGTTDIVPLLLIGGAAATLAGVVIAVPALRIGGWSLAMASFFLVICLPDVVAIFTRWTGGRNGLVGIPAPTLFGETLDTTALYEVIIVVCIVWFAAYRNLVTSRFGTLFRILRESPVQASSLGYSPARLKLTAYAYGAFPAGLAGVLFGFVGEFLQPESFGLTLAIGIVAASVLGGIESVYGVIAGAAILQLGPQGSLSFQEYAPIAYGAFLIVAAILFRRGLGGIGQDLLLRAANMLVGRRAGAAVTSAGTLSAHLHGDTVAEAHAAEGAGGVPLLSARPGAPLQVSGASKAFGGVKALDDVTLSAEPGRVTALIGSNGSGKTTLLNVICGYAGIDGGEVSLDGETVSGRQPHRIAALGVGRTFQTPSMPRSVSVLDVVASGRFHTDRCGPLSSIFRLPRYWRARRADRERALIPLDLVGLAHLADDEASSLSLGTRRLVEVARALCGEPRLLLLDEPASGLSDEEVERLGRAIRAAAASGTTVVLIEHNFGFVTSVSDTAHVLHIGRLIASGPAKTIGEIPAVIESYLGSSAKPGSRRTLVQERALVTGPTTRP